MHTPKAAASKLLFLNNLPLHEKEKGLTGLRSQ
jgi:hypothetical protein